MTLIIVRPARRPNEDGCRQACCYRAGKRIDTIRLIRVFSAMRVISASRVISAIRLIRVMRIISAFRVISTFKVMSAFRVISAFRIMSVFSVCLRVFGLLALLGNRNLG